METAFRATVHRAYMFVAGMMMIAISASAQSGPAAPADTRQTRPEQTLALQVALDRAGFSPGEIDGRGGPKTRLALSAFQESVDLRPTGVADEETLNALGLPIEPLVSYTITSEDVAGPFIGALPDDMMERATLAALAYTSPLEAIAERFHASPTLLQELNPGATWAAGETITVPNVEPFELPAKGIKLAGPAVHIVVSGRTKSLVVRDERGKILMHAPVTVGSTRDPLPLGEWKVTGTSWNPSFNYNPDLFWDANPAHAKAKIAPGPNNPVGVVWIDINKEHFGLHGTPEPARIGRAESHGCIRLTNWDATKLGRLVSVGSKVTIR